MTFKKINKMGQAILEYFILTGVVLLMVLVFLTSRPFQDIKNSCEDKFESAAVEILK